MQDRVRRLEVGVREERAGLDRRHRHQLDAAPASLGHDLGIDRERAVDPGPDDERRQSQGIGSRRLSGVWP